MFLTSNSPPPMTLSIRILEASISLAKSLTAWLGSSYVWGWMYVLLPGSLTVEVENRGKIKTNVQECLHTFQLVYFCRVNVGALFEWHSTWLHNWTHNFFVGVGIKNDSCFNRNPWGATFCQQTLILESVKVRGLLCCKFVATCCFTLVIRSKVHQQSTSDILYVSKHKRCWYSSAAA